MKDLKKMYRSQQSDPFPGELHLTVGDQELIYKKRGWTIQGEEKGLRYGENPNQPAAMYELHQGNLELNGLRFVTPNKGLLSSLKEEHIVQSGKHPSKINLTDVDNGINILQHLTAKPAAVILKHNNPSGAGWSDSGVTKALSKAYACDRIAAFGGAVVVNSPVTQELASYINERYFEVVAAPEFESGSVDILSRRKNLRILKIPGLGRLEEMMDSPFLEFKSLVDGGLIAQYSYLNEIRSSGDWIPAEAQSGDTEVVARQPTAAENEDLLFAWAVETGVTSNSVLFAKDGATVAIGTGEQDRVGCVDITIHKAHIKYADNLAFERTGLSIYELRQKAKQETSWQETLQQINQETEEAKGGLRGSVLVSDGFFPFRDGVDLAIEQGITAVAQPGGSMKDHEVIQAVNQADPQVAMVFTGQRSFRH
ncbi:MAG: IMP cyclohydrolase [Desulfohalobiaceae bacterium]|nr:IMP cyclohydrolase [Desulfohalobiaceae bacterium]